MSLTSYPARQRNRRLAQALRHAVLGLVALVAAGAAASTGPPVLAVVLLTVSCCYAVRSRTSVELARRSAIGARSEDRVRAELRALELEGWCIRHSQRWRGGGDIDHLAIAPVSVGLAFPIETKTRSYGPHDLARITTVAQSLARRRAHWCSEGAVPVLCLAGAHRVERWEAGVAVVSADRLTAVLSRLAGATRRPGFLR